MTKINLPDLIPPMLAKSGKMPADYENYAFEIKWDGLRAVTYINNGAVRILSRNHKDITSQYPELTAIGSGLPGQRLILDGEIVAFGADGRPSFSRLQHRMNLSSPRSVARVRQHTPVTYIIFDLLFADDRLLVDLPYPERRRLLQELALTGPSWQTPAYQEGAGPAMQAATKENSLEGVIAKRLDSVYEPGKRSGAWLKIKNQYRQELVIAGWVPGQGRRSGSIGAVLVGYYDQTPDQASSQGRTQQLLFAGKVGTGFSDKTLADLKKKLTALKIANSPFAEGVPDKDAVFATPSLVGEFEFTEWTPHNTLRHPSFKGLRNDKDPRQVVREQV